MRVLKLLRTLSRSSSISSTDLRVLVSRTQFRDNRNKDNIVAKRGALFMIDLKTCVQDRGFTVAHIKTDSIKDP